MSKVAPDDQPVSWVPAVAAACVHAHGHWDWDPKPRWQRRPLADSAAGECDGAVGDVACAGD